VVVDQVAGVFDGNQSSAVWEPLCESIYWDDADLGHREHPPVGLHPASTDEALAVLDDVEGVDSGLFRRIFINVEAGRAGPTTGPGRQGSFGVSRSGSECFQLLPAESGSMRNATGTSSDWRIRQMGSQPSSTQSAAASNAAATRRALAASILVSSPTRDTRPSMRPSVCCDPLISTAMSRPSIAVTERKLRLRAPLGSLSHGPTSTASVGEGTSA